ncbi:MAG: tetratricopeptide repeat protein [Planctomycetota bacterium]
MDCSVVIPCLGGADLTAACLDSLRQQDAPHRLQVILVDNAGCDATAALARRPGVEVLRQERNLGFAGGCNRGLAHARSPFVLVLNNDTQAAPGLLSRLERALRRCDRIAFAAPISNRVKGPARIDCGDHGRTDAGRREIERELCDPARDRVQDTDSLSGLCLLGRAATWRQLGGFDERFMPGNFEDDDLSLRARLFGHRLVIAGDAFLHHEAHRAFAALGIDMRTELERQHAVFRGKWCADPAGRAVLAALGGDRDGAAAAAETARRLHPRWPDADWHLGRRLADQGRHEEAIPHLRALLQHSPMHPDALVRLGECELRSGADPRTRARWRAALARCWFASDQGANLLTRLGDHAWSTGDHEAAIADLRAAAELRPDDAALQNRLGALLIELRRFDEAIPVLERAAASGLALAHTNLGICHFHRGFGDLALSHFARAAQQLPDDPTAQDNYRRARAASGVGGC